MARGAGKDSKTADPSEAVTGEASAVAEDGPAGRQDTTLLQETLENLNQGISVFDAELRLVAWNRRILELLEFPMEFGQWHRPFADFIRYNAERGEYGPGDVAQLTAERVELARDFKAHRFERTRPDGTVIEVAGNPMPGGGFVTTYTDITERHRAETALSEATARLDAAIESFSDGFVLFDADDRFVLCNSAYRNAHPKIPEIQTPGTRMETIVRKLAEIGFYGNQPDQIEAVVRERMERHRTGRPYDYRMADGRWFRMTEYDAHDGGTALVRIDITDRKQAEEALRESEARYRTLSDLTNEGVCIHDDGVIVEANQAYAQMHGYTVAEMIGRDVRDLTAPEARARVADNIAANPEDSYESVNLRRDGRPFPTEVKGMPISYQGRALRAARVRDLTEQRRAQAAIVAAKEEAEYASRAKTEFLANISHELRTPLNAIVGFSEMIEQQTFGPVGDPRYEEYAAHIRESGGHLLDLINEILDLSRIEARQAEIVDSELDPAELVRAAASLVRVQAQTNGLNLAIEVSKTLPKLLADERMLKQMLINLLSNAVKFTPKGGDISISAGLTADHGMELTVRDTGIGIAPEDLPKALERFGQIDGSHHRQHGGAGLGLPLVTMLAELHGGELVIDSRIGIGTAATIRLPRHRVLASEG
ncbi:MAG: PAS-domain containing protein [Alphaproteobacteria bacterium]|jgi:two-component system cell cycle sensor histidine kinase PleC|nr:PAS-domain containing protein [Alphaproteobacteria bacterium]